MTTAIIFLEFSDIKYTSQKGGYSAVQMHTTVSWIPTGQKWMIKAGATGQAKKKYFVIHLFQLCAPQFFHRSVKWRGTLLDEQDSAHCRPWRIRLCLNSIQASLSME